MKRFHGLKNQTKGKIPANATHLHTSKYAISLTDPMCSTLFASADDRKADNGTSLVAHLQELGYDPKKLATTSWAGDPAMRYRRASVRLLATALGQPIALYGRTPGGMHACEVDFLGVFHPYNGVPRHLRSKLERSTPTVA